MRLRLWFTISVCIFAIASCVRVDPALDPVEPLNPENHTSVEPGSLEFTWSEPDEDGIQSYDVQVALRGDFAERLVHSSKRLETPLIVVSGIERDEIYYWRIRYRAEGRRRSEWTSPFTFGTIAAIPRTTGPNNEAFIVDRTPALSWSGVEAATAYDIEIAADREFGSDVIIFSDRSPETQRRVDTRLTVGSEYHWRVRARFPGNVAGYWSEPSSFHLVGAFSRSYGLYEREIDVKTFAIAPGNDEIAIGGHLRTQAGTDTLNAWLGEDGEVKSALAGGFRVYDELIALTRLGDSIVGVANCENEDDADASIWISGISDERHATIQLAVTDELLDGASDIASLADGTLIVAATVINEERGDRDGWLARLSGAGEVLAQIAYGSDADEELVSIAPTEDGIVGVGTVREHRVIGTGLWVIRVGAEGEIIWQKRFDTVFDDKPGGPGAVTVGHDGSIYIAATASDRGRFAGSMLVLQLDPDGRLVRRYRFAGESEAYASSVALRPDGRVVIGGGVMTESPLFYGPVRTMKVLSLNANGSIDWQRGTSAAYPRTTEDLWIGPDSAIYSVGWWYEFSMNASFVVRFDSEGRFPTDPVSTPIESASIVISVANSSAEARDTSFEFYRPQVGFYNLDLETRVQWP